MTQEKQLARISKASFGFGGYDDAMIGLSVSLDGKSWGVGDFQGDWAIDRSDHCQWTEEDRVRRLGEVCMFLRDLLRKSGKKTVSDLVGVPVEVTLEGNKLVSWRVLDEVLP